MRLKESKFISSKVHVLPATTAGQRLCAGKPFLPPTKPRASEGDPSSQGIASLTTTWLHPDGLRIQSLGMSLLAHTGHLFACLCRENNFAGKPIPEIQSSASGVLQE